MSGENREKYYRNLKEFFDFLFPQVCVFCGNYVEDFSDFGSICEKCRKKVADEFFGGFMDNVNGIERVWYVGIYRSFLKECINKFKFFGELTLGNFLGKVLYEVILRNPLKFDVITYVPLHRKKLISRGYNQAKIVANFVGQRSDIKCEKLLKKVKNNLPQSSVGAVKREKNVKGVFDLLKEKKLPQSVLIVDDVYTTGSTLRECCRLLKKRGVSNVYGGVLALDYLL